MVSSARPSKNAMALTIPVMMGYFPLGIVFGFLIVQAGAVWWLAPLMSLLVFAGAAQFLAIALLTAGASVPEIALACFIVNLRHIFYGISVIDILPRRMLGRLYCICALTDENYSLITGIGKAEATRNALAITALNHTYWVLSALLGALLGKAVTFTMPGLDFSLTALFTVLAVEQFRRIRDITLPLIAVVSYWVAIQISPTQPLFIAICIGGAGSLCALTIREQLAKRAGASLEKKA